MALPRAIRTNSKASLLIDTLEARSHWLAAGYRNPTARKRAIVAIVHTLIEIVWHVLVSSKSYTGLGSDFYTCRADPETKTQAIDKLEAFGRKVIVAPAA